MMEYDEVQPAPDLSQEQQANGLSGFINPQQMQTMTKNNALMQEMQRQAMVSALRNNSGSNMQKGASDLGKGLGSMLGGGMGF